MFLYISAEQCWYQHDGAPAHYLANARQLLDDVPKERPQWPRRVAGSVIRHDAIRFLLVERDEVIGERNILGL